MIDSPFEFSQQEKIRENVRTLTYLVCAAVREQYGNVPLTLEYAVGNAHFFRVLRDEPLLPADIESIQKRVQKMVADRVELKSKQIAKKDVSARGLHPAFPHMENYISDYSGRGLCLYRLNGEYMAFKGPLLDNADHVAKWELIFYPPGFLLRIARDDKQDLMEYTERPKLFRTFFSATRWGAAQKASFVHEVNERVKNGSIKEFIQVAEAFQARQIADIADQIKSMQPQPRVILISGPSSSGKTSFSNRLRIELQLLGFEPLTLGLDNFYHPRSKIPRKPDGEYDYETIDALDVSYFNETLLRLIAGEQVAMPELEFKTHTRKKGKTVSLNHDGILIVEGIHGLNPRLTVHLTAPSVFKIYVSALTHLNFDELNRVSTTDLRQLRRIVRDKEFRGYPTEDTLSRWPTVREGEQKHIFPFQEHADVMFNSALPYELNALKPKAKRALTEVSDKKLLPEAKRLLRFLAAVEAIPEELSNKHLPPTSILREFLGGSVLV